MRMLPIRFYRYEKLGEDVLGNELTELVFFNSSEGRLTNWSKEEIALLDREVTKTQRKLITHTPKEIVLQADVVEVEGDYYSISNDITDFGRWRLLKIKAVRV